MMTKLIYSFHKNNYLLLPADYRGGPYYFSCGPIVQIIKK